MYRLTAASNVATDVTAGRFSCRVANSLKNRSARLSHEEDVGVHRLS
jgi:hypothetical protein